MSEAIREALETTARPTTLCAFCPKLCRFACPVSEAEARETVTPWAKMSLVHLARLGAEPLDEPDAIKAIEACTGCGACVESCAHGNPVAETLFVARDASKSERSQQFRAAFEASGDVRGRDLDTPLEALPKDGDAVVAYFPGCTRLTSDDGRVDDDLAALEIAAGEPIPACDLPAKSGCCGYPLYADGQLDLLRAHLTRLTDTFARHEVVVTPDPGCAYVLNDVRKSVLDEELSARWPKVLPLVEVLGRRATKFEGQAAGMRLRYHDPCYLGRRGGTFDAPRALLRAATGLAPEEFAERREGADCSGAGGLYPVSNPEGAKAIAQRRAEQDPMAHVEVDAVVTACPSARRNFERAGVRALDIVDVVLGRAGER